MTIATLTVGAQSPRRPAQSSLRNERAFATELQRALRIGDRQTVTSLVRYPARVSVFQRPRPIYVKDRDALEQMYDMVFTPHLRCAVVDSREPVVGKSRPTHTLLLARGVVSLGIAEVGADRVPFSVDYPFEETADAAEWFDSAPIPESDRLRIGAENATLIFTTTLSTNTNWAPRGHSRRGRSSRRGRPSVSNAYSI